MAKHVTTRRDFLATGVAVPMLFLGRYTYGQSANEAIGIGAIGVGGRGSGIGNEAARFGVMLACADVDRSHASRFASRYEGKCEIYEDYRKILDRKDIDVVTIGTPDHWHTKIAVEALRAGKDVYCEKPLTLTIDEGKILRRVVAETKRVFQVGTQQRSDRRFLQAVALARSGRLGKKLVATCSIGAGPQGGPFPTSEPPAELNWDFWLG
ncbi:MAG TPA: Gfo/Idh/MocA family oxidoreductase, partial [Thermogutta sp.]|nr:Gfo/Idh/MocA family oxidoreductase [Thermogutta sp.]